MAKLGRNMCCPCGSGDKYKKCCMNRATLEREERFNETHFENVVKSKHSNKEMTFINANQNGMIKMSEVVLDFADELLLIASTKEAKERIIMIAIVAWNIALLEQSEHEEKIHDFLNTLKIEENSDDWKEMFNIVQALVYKKNTEFHSVDRTIVDFDFFEMSSGDYHLNIASSVNAN